MKRRLLHRSLLHRSLLHRHLLHRHLLNLRRLGLVQRHLRWLSQLGQALREQRQFIAHMQAYGPRGIDHRGDFGRRQPGALEHRLLALHQIRAEGTADKARLGRLRAQGRQLWRRLAGVGHRHLRTAAQAPARQGQPRQAQPEHQHMLVLQAFHRSFRVDRPTRHSSMVMIQKRTTTCVSFQPLFSKW